MWFWLVMAIFFGWGVGKRRGEVREGQRRSGKVREGQRWSEMVKDGQRRAVGGRCVWKRADIENDEYRRAVT